MLKQALLAASILIFCTPSLVSACTCAFSAGSCNQDWKLGQVIFTGTVTEKSTVTASGDDYFSTNAFQFSVSESFRGGAIAGQDITVYTGRGGGDCGYPFKIGISYLVYASLHNGKLVTNICTPTSPAARMLGIIRQLRALQKGEPVADLFGMIGTSPINFTDDPLEIKPLAGKRVRVIGSSNLAQSTTTDEEGVYSFQTLPADTYRIEIDPPAGMSTWQINKGEAYKVQIGAQGIFGCPASLSFSADGRIKGKVVDQDGNGLAGFVTLEPVDAKEAEAARLRGGTMGYTTDSGEFELWLLRPSQYRLIFHPKIGEQVNFRVPPVKSEVITVGLGQHVENFRFKVPAVRP
jgi:hypothetical protein